MRLYLEGFLVAVVSNGGKVAQRWSLWDDGDLFANNYKKFTATRVNASEGKACTSRPQKG